MQRFIIFVVVYTIDLMKITLLTVGKTDRDWVRQGLGKGLLFEESILKKGGNNE